jgi:cell wall-associated NlpC family hydrolase
VTRTAPRLLAALCAAALGTAALSGCGASTTPTARNAAATGPVALHGRPQVVQPVAGVQAEGVSASGSVSASASGSSGMVSVTPAPGTTLQQPVSNAQVEQELTASGINPNPDRATLTASGLAIPPANAPQAVVQAIQAANEIAHLPYIWGGGHGTYEDNGYDCSGSLSFILASAGLLDTTETSGEFMSYGDAGLGKWITIYAMNGHTFAYIAGLRFDTVALAETGTRWSNRPADEPNLSSFVARHPAGL